MTPPFKASDDLVERKEWRCFHCDETFTDVVAAQEHFGYSLHCEPACRLNEMEGGLLKILRKQEHELDCFRAEDTASSREFYRLGAEHSQALIREEEKGYAKGIADGRAQLAAAEAALKNADIFLTVGAAYAPDQKVDDQNAATGEWLRTRGLATVMLEAAKACREALRSLEGAEK